MRFVSYYLRCHPPEGVSAAGNRDRREEGKRVGCAGKKGEEEVKEEEAGGK